MDLLNKVLKNKIKVCNKLNKFSINILNLL